MLAPVRPWDIAGRTPPPDRNRGMAGKRGTPWTFHTSFDLRTDAGGKDPDKRSPTLRRYHRLLWSEPLPGGAMFDLDDTAVPRRNPRP